MSDQPIIIRRIKKAAHAHHGGAWKIAYADFVTAMMAFFLLMWLISMTTKEQKKGLADYFAPASVTSTNSGAGGILRGNAIDDSGNRSSGARHEQVPRAPFSPRDAAMGAAGQEDAAQNRASAGEVSRPAARREQAHDSAVASIRQALQDMPELTEVSRNIVIEPTKAGLNVSLVDQDGRSMFPEGSVHPYERAHKVLEALAPTLRRLPNRLSVTGHTAAARPGSKRVEQPWEVSTGRAVSVREILAANGLPDDRFALVAGRGDTEPVFSDNPYLAPNRRVTITLLDEEPPTPPSLPR
jgi:chemotaxis protein MotB